MSNLDHVKRMSGASYRQLDFWCRRGYLKPQGGVGQGHQRYWPGDEIRVAVTMKRLVDNGVSASAAAHAARNGGVLPAGLRVLLDQQESEATA